MLRAQATDRTGARAAPRPYRNAVLLGPFDEFGHDQKVAGKPHLLDDAKFIAQSFAIRLGGPLAIMGVLLGCEDMDLQPPLQSLPRLTAQFLRLAKLGGERRQDGLTLLHHEGAAAGDNQRVLYGLGQIAEQFAHLGGRFEIVFRGQAAAIFLGDIAALGDADQRVMRLVHGRIGEERLIGGDQRQVVPIGQFHQLRLDAVFRLQTMALQLDVKAPRKRAGKAAQAGLRLVGLSLGDQPADRSHAAAGQGDQAIGAFLDVSDRDLRKLARLGFQKGFADQLQQIGVAGVVLGEQNELIRIGRARGVAGRKSTRVGVATNPQLHADDRLYAGIRASQ